ncbi:MAG: NAD(P)/FAD-dependent oxidoreductase [Thermoplasmata archaeon]|nr:NAD(P)/FAD-dependent oxidoreductase [Thermoplasmata archaeon]
MKYDLIVVGAGPGGANAAYHAAQAGAKTLIIDKKSEIGVPVRCAEAIVSSLLPEYDIKPDPKWVANKISHIKSISSKGRVIDLKTATKGYILDRTEFEKMLVKRAEDKGAEVLLRATVTGLSKKGLNVYKASSKTRSVFSSKIIIAADGVESRVGRWGGMNTTLALQDIGVCAQYQLKNIEIDPDCVELYWGEKYAPGGYAWAFPKNDNLANVGVVIPGNFKFTARELLDKFVNWRAPKSKIIKSIVGCVPEAIPPESFVKGNLMLVGDAARVSIPVTGGGIGNALFTGRAAGVLAGEVINNNLSLEHLMNYNRIVHKKLTKRLKRAYKLKERLIKSEKNIERVFILLKPFMWLHKLAPNFIEKHGLKNLRY